MEFDVDADEFSVDLLFFHIEQLRYVVVELKVGKFRPEYVGQLGFYVGVVENHLRRAAHAPTVGLLLCTDKIDRVVRYALASSTHPPSQSPATTSAFEDQAALPSEADLDRAVSKR